MCTDVVFVVIKEGVAQGVVIRRIRFDGKAKFEQAARAMRGLGAGDFQRERRQVACGAGVVECGGEVGSGVGEGAVKVEQDGFDHR